MTAIWGATNLQVNCDLLVLTLPHGRGHAVSIADAGHIFNQSEIRN